jgi:hypothetical protein
VGGGPLRSDGSVAGWRLVRTPVRGSLTVPAHGGVVLLS